MEKSSLPLSSPNTPAAPPRSSRPSFVRVLLTLALGVALVLYIVPSPTRHWHHHQGQHQHHVSSSKKNQCHQPKPLHPSTGDKGLDDLWMYLSTQEFRNASVRRHSGAVQIPTESFDDMGPIGQDTRWEIMYSFEGYLEKTFPLIHADLDKENVNTHGLLYTWHGSDSDLKPLVLMAHQDVVPVPAATVDDWTYPPFSGHYDGTFIWGRGSNDCKNQLIALMETVELLLEAKWQPKRTILLSFGFDEEVSGPQGAGHLAPFLLDRYGKDGVAAIVDEGAGYVKQWGSTFAAPGVGEKGYLDALITVRMPGGHSSIPSDHTSIGVLAEIITHIEAEQYPPHLTDNNPFLGFLQCSAEYAPEFPKKLKKLLKHRNSGKATCAKTKKKGDVLAEEAAKLLGPPGRYLMQTSQAVDIINGGVKTNALPERAVATVNHRINIGEDTDTVKAHLTKIVKPIAKKHNLTLHAFDDSKETKSSIILSARNDGLRPAPVTPTQIGGPLAPYEILAGTVRALYGEDMTVAPAIMTGNTDTRYYWDLSPHIFRFNPGYDAKDDAGLGRIHTVDERINVDNHIAAVKWFTMFVQNMDAADLKA